MWSQDYAERLQQWHDLRRSCRDRDEDQRWMDINNWWWQAPWVQRGILWHDFPEWPGPWDLLCQTSFSDLDRALGIVYTVLMLDIPDPIPVSLVFDGQDNLVWINDGKYILNWAPGQLLNIRSHPRSPVRAISGDQIQKITTGTA